MKKFLWGTFMVIAGMFTTAVGTRAQSGVVMMHVDHDFIAGGKSFPAGTYKVYPDSSPSGQTLILRGEGGSVILLPTTHDWTSTLESKVKLRRTGEMYYLSEVASDLGVYTFPAPPALTRMAKARDQDAKPAGGGK
jgi:hypothetical protein